MSAVNGVAWLLHEDMHLPLRTIRGPLKESTRSVDGGQRVVERIYALSWPLPLPDAEDGDDSRSTAVKGLCVDDPFEMGYGAVVLTLSGFFKATGDNDPKAITGCKCLKIASDHPDDEDVQLIQRVLDDLHCASWRYPLVISVFSVWLMEMLSVSFPTSHIPDGSFVTLKIRLSGICQRQQSMWVGGRWEHEAPVNRPIISVISMEPGWSWFEHEDTKNEVNDFVTRLPMATSSLPPPLWHIVLSYACRHPTKNVASLRDHPLSIPFQLHAPQECQSDGILFGN